MKKTILILLVISLLVLCGCGKKAEAAPAAETAAPEATATPAASGPDTTPEPENTPEPEAEPETEPGTAKPLQLWAVLESLQRGDTLEIIGDAKEGYEDYIIVKAGDKYGLVEKRFLRMEDDVDYASWTGYTRPKAELYTVYYHGDEEPLTPKTNTVVTVLDELDDCYVVEYEGKEYVVLKELLGKTKYYYSGGGSSSSGESSNDGGDITLAFPAPTAMFIDQSGESTGKATVRINGTPLILCIYDRDEDVKILEKGEEVCKLFVFGMEAETETRLIRFKGDEAYEAWTGYAVSGAKLYDNPWLGGAGVNQNTNAKFEVIEDLGYCYLVSGESGEGYMHKDDLGTKQVWYSYSSDDETSTGWTEPKL